MGRAAVEELLTTNPISKGNPMKAHLIRQGDVLIIPITEENADKLKVGKRVRREKGRVVLAHGEVTGHAHAIDERKVDMFEIDGQTGTLAPDRLLVVEADGVVLRHEEHAKLALPAGKYIVRKQREYSPAALRNVAD